MRLFIALWPPADVTKTIQQWSDAHLKPIGGKRIPAEQMHITLQFLDEVEQSKLSQLQKVLAEHCSQIPPFSVTINTLDVWKKSGLCVLLGDHATKMAVTARKLHCLIDKTAGYTVTNMAWTSNRVPRFKPHITLVRKLPDDANLPKQCPNIQWQANEIVLVHSVLSPKGPTYKILKRFQLTGN